MKKAALPNKLAEHRHYEHYSEKMVSRLDGFYGRVDERLNKSIAVWVKGRDVLDLGCGFGSLAASLQKCGFRVVGTDLLEKCVSAGQVRYPGVDLRIARSKQLEFMEKTFDTVVMKDVLHHIVAESDVSEFFQGLTRVLKQRVILVDPNPTLILLIARKFIGHIDPVCGPSAAVNLLEKHGFIVRATLYSEVFAFPLSGGYVGPVLVSRHLKMLGSIILFLDKALLFSLRLLHLDKYLCWRYMLVADLPDSCRSA